MTECTLFVLINQNGLNKCYLDALGLVLLLLSLQRELDKQLLELLVAIVNAKLLKTETHTPLQSNTLCMTHVQGSHPSLWMKSGV